jgi:S-adenosylmethionine:tRNA ribosyltransferase-isomerase
VPPAGLRTADYDFVLPPERIAQHPTDRRDASRLMVVDRGSGAIAHHAFTDLPGFLAAGDAIVLNTTRVFHARLLGTRDGSGAPAEILLLRAHEDPGAATPTDAHRSADALVEGRTRQTWEAMVQPGAKLKPGRVVTIAEGFTAEMGAATGRGTRLVTLRADDVRAAIARHGHVPLPPYIARPDAAVDEERYQTVYAREEGSVAAPTAGLHFTPALLDALAARGVRRADVLLHVGAGTFRPVEVDDPAEHRMHEEWYRVEPEAAAQLDATRAAGGRVCAVGTTALRTLESILGPDGRYRPGSGDTDIFIRPPQRPRAADLLLTNFHLPRSTLIMLVAAMAGYDLTMHAYDVAVREGYRFYSYGDAMLIHG